MLPEMPQRPGGESEALEVSLAGDNTNVAPATGDVRCTRCGHALTAAKSVELEIGPVCRREVAA